ncbi:outer membrane beta-barrel protein [Oricola sp.]|uniref:outer membrane protein n=1 Tax=Oricola sp. TaxID=1979950 RepID=UPI0025F6BE57|nr:outer membrane beta-barrel protein [Oricola sp.]MCI5077616.1 outer membrane beta-barrel protein [Oricola sp.]
MFATKLIATVATLAALGGVARADEASNLFAPVAMTQDWEGFYAGVQLGGGTFETSGGSSDTAALGGAHAGYLWQTGRFVFGPEFDVNASGWAIGGTHMDATASAKLRAGVAFDRTLVTGSVGYAHKWASAGPLSFDAGGLALGAGIDFAATDRVIVGADYTYTDIDDFGFSDTNSHSVRARLSFRFD